VGRVVLDASDSVYRLLEGCCEHGVEPTSCIKDGEFLD
jgi:hypothetical protein